MVGLYYYNSFLKTFPISGKNSPVVVCVDIKVGLFYYNSVLKTFPISGKNSPLAVCVDKKVAPSPLFQRWKFLPGKTKLSRFLARTTLLKTHRHHRFNGENFTGLDKILLFLARTTRPKTHRHCRKTKPCCFLARTICLKSHRHRCLNVENSYRVRQKSADFWP